MRTTLLWLFVAACAHPSAPKPPTAPEPTPPVAETRAHELTSPFGVRSDPYFWLRDDTRKDPAVLGYLRAEAEYANAMLAPAAALKETIYHEIVSRIAEDDQSVPIFDRGYFVYTRVEAGKQYPIICRRKGTMEAPEEIVVDGNQLAVGHAYLGLGNVQISPDGTKVAYAVDTVGRYQFELHIKDLTTGRLLPDTASGLSGSLVWANDSKTLFYVLKDPTTLRSHKVMRHVVGTPAEKDALVHEETDTSFYTSIDNTRSRRYVVIALHSTVSTEMRLVDADRPTSAPRVMLPRERDHEYWVDHAGDRFVIMTNWQAKNFRLATAGEAELGDRGAWRDLLPHRPDAFIENYHVYRDFVAVSERSGGLGKVRIVPRKGDAFLVDADEPAYTMGLMGSPDENSSTLRYTYTSLTTPSTVFELDVATRARKVLKVEPVRGGYDASKYVTDYLHVKADDGASIPISVVRRKDVPKDGKAPLLVYGYGSYGYAMDPGFVVERLPLLDRGWVYAIAHIRGGQEMGRAWYDGGKLMNKKNTFTDFIRVTEHLVAEGYGRRDAVFAMGGSAGGLLVGAVVNMRPDLYRGVVAKVPFVDVVTTMLDDSIPLTSNEFDEWGDPRQRAAYEYMLSYSPYDNVRAQAYPSMFVETGLHDSQVQYFEPAKWVAKLRATKTDGNPLLFHVNMEAGHGGKSGRYEKFDQIARTWVFLLTTLERPDRRAHWP